MDNRDSQRPTGAARTPVRAEPDIPQLVGDVYEAASAPERVSLIEHLMSPLSLLAAFAVSNGIFARLWFQRGFHDQRIRIEDTDIVGKADIAALASFVQQVSVDAVDSIGQIVSSSPTLAATAAAALLLAAIARKLRTARDASRAEDQCPVDPSQKP
jgi:hypothetical protein